MCDTAVTNMAVQSMWIRKHMLQSPCSDIGFQGRQLSENEKRVLRSIQKLSIPDWYLNNNSRPPRILSNDTPMDQRPAPWKNASAEKSSVPKMTIAQSNNSTVCHNGIMETKIESASKAKKNNGTCKINRNSPPKKSLSPIKQDQTTKNHNLNKSGGKSRPTNISQTFPRLSPCRKIQNINIVFPREMVNQKRLMITDLDDCCDTSVINIATDSVDEKQAEKNDRSQTQSWNCRDEDSSQESAQSLEKSQVSIEKDSNSNRTWGKTNYRTSVRLFPIEIPPAGNQSKVGNDDTEPRMTTSGKGNKRPAASPPKKAAAPEHQVGVPNNTIIMKPSSGSVHRTSSFRPKNMLPPIPEKGTEPRLFINRPKINPNKSAKRSSFNSTIQSDDPDTTFNPPKSSEKSLVSEIIEELNRRCSISSKSTYVSPSSKTFVKKLVRDLENGIRPVTEKIERAGVAYKKLTNCKEEEDFSEEDVFICGENSSEDEIKSVAMSTSISFKGTDSSSSRSSPTNPESPTLRYNDVYDWESRANGNDELLTNNNDNQELNRNLEEAETIDDDDWMYWNQKADWNLPRTSSRLSFVSSQSVDQSCPCVSPIDPPNDLSTMFSAQSSRLSSNGWGIIYRTRKSDFERECRRKEATTLDSGYSDRSGSPPSGNEDKNSFDSTETTQTASENSSYCNDLYEDSVSPGRPRGRIFGRSLMV